MNTRVSIYAGITDPITAEAPCGPDPDADPLDGDNGKEPALDPIRDEALNILSDLADLSQGPKTASATAPAAVPNGNN